MCFKELIVSFATVLILDSYWFVFVLDSYSIRKPPNEMSLTRTHYQESEPSSPPSEIEDAIKRLRQGKASGFDGV